MQEPLIAQTIANGSIFPSFSAAPAPTTLSPALGIEVPEDRRAI